MDAQRLAARPGDLPDDWAARLSHLDRSGLNTAGVADGRPYQDWLPGCRAVLVLGSGGPGLWQALREEIAADPRRLSLDPDPLDQLVRRRVAEADPAPPPSRRWAFADARQAPALPVQELALAAGLGWRSTLWLILHPVHGPWMGLRAACFTTEELPIDGPRQDPSPCATCAAPCIRACPGRALRSGEMDWRWCTVHRAASRDCLDLCHSREACPQGVDSRYPPEEMAWHHDKARGRRALAQALGIRDQAAPPPVDWAGHARRALALLKG